MLLRWLAGVLMAPASFPITKMPQPSGESMLKLGQTYRVVQQGRSPRKFIWRSEVYRVCGIDPTSKRAWLATVDQNYEGYDGDLLVAPDAFSNQAGFYRVVLCDERCSIRGCIKLVPTEDTLGAAPLVEFTVGTERIWYSDTGTFCVASASTGDVGDSFDTYREAVDSLA